MSSTLQEGLMWRCTGVASATSTTMRIASRAVAPGGRRRIASVRFFEIKTRRLGGFHIKPRVKSE
jgi:hypothetical protein